MDSYEVYPTREQLQTIHDTIPELRVGASIALCGKDRYRLYLSAEELVKCCQATGKVLRHYHYPVAQLLRGIKL